MTGGGVHGEAVGSCCIVLHSHLPWLPHHGTWPVGEEWLYQAWAGSYLPLTRMLTRLADEGRQGLLTLGVTPVLAAMLDDPSCLAEVTTWSANWLLRSEAAAVDGVGVAGYEACAAHQTLDQLAGAWSAGASPVLRGLADAGVVELVGGPLSHPFQPLLPERVVRAQLTAGLDDATTRVGTRPGGIWAPECAYRPGLEKLYADAGVSHFLVDGPTVGGDTAAGYDVAGSGVVAFARDLDLAYRVWSPRAGYPGGPWYRDFHTFDHASGLKPSRVTSQDSAPQDKAPYDPAAARTAARADAADFVAAVRQRLLDVQEARGGRPGLAVVAYDTELFGHWWHEGPMFLEAVLRGLPEAGVRVMTLQQALEDHVDGARELPAGSWGAGKDWHVWSDPGDLVDLGEEVSERLLRVVDKQSDPRCRNDAVDQLGREAFLALSSDWAFMVSHDSTPDYARRRAHGHAQAFHDLADALEDGDAPRAAQVAARLRAIDRPFPGFDARSLLPCAS